jgi:hypothetical protein
LSEDSLDAVIDGVESNATGGGGPDGGPGKVIGFPINYNDK